MTFGNYDPAIGVAASRAASTYHNLGVVAQVQRRFEQAEAYYRQALDIYLESDLRSASETGTRLGVVLAELGRHSEAAATLLRAAATWRQETGRWDRKDLQLLNGERSMVGASEYETLVQANIPADLAEEFATAMRDAAEPDEPGNTPAES